MWHPENIYGYLAPDEGKRLQELAKGNDVLEIGSFCGKSATFMAPVAKRLVCVDPFSANLGGQDNLGWPVCFPHFLVYTHQFKNIVPIVARSLDILWAFGEGTFDFIFIDANHTYDDVKAEIHAVHRVLKDGGYLACHDYYDGFPGCMKAIDEFAPPVEVVGVTAITKKELIRGF